MLKSLIKRIDPDLVRLYAYFLPHKGKLLLSVLFLVASASTSSVTATLLGKLTDLGFYKEAEWVIYAAPAALMAMTLVYTVSTVMSAYLMAKASQSVLVTLRTSLFDNMLHWPEPRYQERTTGAVSSKFVNEATIALGDATSSVIIMVRDSVQIMGLLCVLFWHNWQLTLVTFLVAPVLVFALQLISKRMRRIVKKSQDALGVMISRVQESYEAERVVKMSGTYDFEEARFKVINQKIRQLALKTIKMRTIGTPISQVLVMVAVAFVVAVALVEAQQGILTIGEFVTFLAAMLLLKEPIQNLASLNATFASISVAARSIFGMLDTETEKDTGSREIERFAGDIVFDNVTLRYPGQKEPALKAISLTVRHGEHVALVGQSGSGKSSFVSLVARFWDPTQGRILFDGIDSRELTLESLRRQMSIVSQDPLILDGTLRTNITYGTPDASEEAVKAAVEAAGLSDFVASLPKGLESEVGEGGSLLSGGQRQRVAIARALLKDAPILILDEATSALDSKTEAHIKEALRRLAQGRTCITVAHRFSSIEYADRIVVMNQGEIVEMGSIEELLSRDGVFKRLSELQAVSDKEMGA
ncbi:MAG: lipid A export permease/ATP-binding protein MsbA [Duodenibacillus sp.]|nr:lipid A export permease/ATP-binding protein MsbA [Duodenibacillus sp.]